MEELVASLSVLGLALWCDGVLWWVVGLEGEKVGYGLEPVDAVVDAGVRVKA